MLIEKRKTVPTKRVQQKGPILSLVCRDFATCTTHTGIEVKCFPEPIYAIVSWASANIQQHAYIGLPLRYHDIRHGYGCGVELPLTCNKGANALKNQR